MQYHAESKAQFSQDRTPWNIAKRCDAPEVISIYRHYANVRMNIIPYLHSESVYACENLQPLMKALHIEYEDDENVVDIYDEYLLGRQLLVAPVIEEGATSRSVYLPNGKWMDLWTKKQYTGGQNYEIRSKINSIPVFLKTNSALIVNVDETGELGSYVGNAVDSYKQMKIIVFATSSFETIIKDHLNQCIRVAVNSESKEVLVEGTDQEYMVEFVEG